MCGLGAGGFVRAEVARIGQVEAVVVALKHCNRLEEHVGEF